MLAAVTTATDGAEIEVIRGQQIPFYVTLTGTGAVSAAYEVQFSGDGVNWNAAVKNSISGTTSVRERSLILAPSMRMRAVCTSISGTGAALTVVSPISGTVDAKAFGVKADGVTDDTAALQAAIDAAAGGTLFLPAGDIAVTAPVVYDCATQGPIRVVGHGVGTDIRIRGTAARAFEFTAEAGVTIANLVLENFQVLSEHDTTATDGILLDGLAVYTLSNITVYGNGKLTNGIRLHGTQQGEISGGYIQGMTDGIVLELSDDIASNGCDMHGVSFAATGRNLVASGTDSLFITNCHFVVAPVGIDIVTGGNGQPCIDACHIESHTTAGVRAATGVRITNTNFFKGTNGNDIVLTDSGGGSLISGNLLQGNVTIGASVTDTRLINNFGTGTGTLTNSGTRTIIYGNVGSSGPVSNAAVLHDSLAITSKAGSAGEIFRANPNAAVGGAWGIGVYGAGADQDVYIKLHGGILAGSTGSSELTMKSGVAGTLFAAFGDYGVDLPEISAPAAPDANTGRLYVRDNGAGKTQLVIRFPTGAVQVIATEP